MANEDQDLGAFTIAQFSRTYGIGITKIYEEIGVGRLRAVKLGRRTMILRGDAQAWQKALLPIKSIAA